MNIQLFHPKGTFFRLYDFIILSFKIFILLSYFDSTYPQSWNDTELICMAPVQGYILVTFAFTQISGEILETLEKEKAMQFIFHQEKVEILQTWGTAMDPFSWMLKRMLLSCAGGWSVFLYSVWKLLKPQALGVM